MRLGALVCLLTTVCAGAASTWAAPSAPRRPMLVSRHAEWFPDGRTIVFESNLERPKSAYAIGEGVAFDDPALDVYAVRADGNGLHNLTREDSALADIRPSVSPDGSRIAYLRGAGSRFELVVMAADGSGKRVLAEGVTTDRPSWSPDGREIGFSACCDGGRRYLYAATADGSARRLIAENAWSAAWSPDGAAIAYVGSVLGDASVFVAESSGHAARAVAGEVEGRTLSWSHDSRRITFDAPGTSRFAYAVAVVPAGGGPAVRLVDGLRRLGAPVWSPAGARLAFGDGDLRAVTADGTENQTIAGGPMLQIEPRWSPTGDRLVFGTEAEPRDWPRVGAYLEVVRSDGSGRVRITPESPPAVQTVIPAASVTLPDRLYISSLRVTPRVVARGGTVTARIVVESGLTGNLVDGAKISVSAPPVVVQVLTRPTRTRDGRAAIRLRFAAVPRGRRTIRLVFVATKPGDVGGTVASARFTAEVRIRR